MDILDIKASLGVTPSYACATTQAASDVITRGASASLSFNFSDKLYSFEDIDQVTFMLQQNKIIYWYKMFTYLKPTADTMVLLGKNYYTNITRNKDSYKCEATPVTDPSGDPAALGYYEEADGNCSWRNTEYLLDERFNHESGDGYDCVSLILFPEDTLQFTAKRSNQLDFEVAVRLNTEGLPGFASRDAILVEAQPSIKVVDSLFSKL